MSDMITAEAAAKLLDDFIALPGYLSEAITVGDLASRREEALRRYQGCAPDLARTVIALHAQLADAKAAQAEVQALRAERDEAQGLIYAARLERNAAEDQEKELAEELRAVRADRDRLAAANAALEAQVARLVGVGDALEAACIKAIGLRKHPAWATIRAWRAEVQADARREGGE